MLGVEKCVFRINKGRCLTSAHILGVVLFVAFSDIVYHRIDSPILEGFLNRVVRMDLNKFQVFWARTLRQALYFEKSSSQSLEEVLPRRYSIVRWSVATVRRTGVRGAYSRCTI